MSDERINEIEERLYAIKLQRKNLDEEYEELMNELLRLLRPKAQPTYVRSEEIYPHLFSFITSSHTTQKVVAEGSGISENVITSILKRNTKYTDARVADKLMIYLDKPHVTFEEFTRKDIRGKRPESQYYEE
jgi:adenylosuccinate synthase